mmetsp:Transcript_4193/g.6361  ORF Transcript_4193/g.6361 Transcript_4193/m.6361 type:complete len:214 (-) Transcript_4193:54-695(-)
MVIAKESRILQGGKDEGNYEREGKRRKLSENKEEDAAAVDQNEAKRNKWNYDLPALDKAYQAALKAYKADKSNKDLRRAKTAAKRAWDEALKATAEPGSKPIVCRNCSQLFIFEMGEEFEERGWETPVQCKDCSKKIGISRSKDRENVDQKQNMCYEYQKTGTCSRGDRCKFSHAKDHVGKKKKAGLLIQTCKYFKNGDVCPHGDKCRFPHKQ